LFIPNITTAKSLENPGANRDSAIDSCSRREMNNPAPGFGSHADAYVQTLSTNVGEL
jgi:hypothetical protein